MPAIDRTGYDRDIRALATLNVPAEDLLSAAGNFPSEWIVANSEESLPSLRNHFLKQPSVAGLLLAGPLAVPALLDHLNDSTKTSTKIVNQKQQILKFGSVWHGNAANPIESGVLTLTRSCYGGGALEDDAFSNLVSQIDSYTFTVGDVCLVILGQIVGRNYPCICDVTKYGTAISSPVYDSDLRKKLIAIWGQSNTRQYIFESLMYDFCTRGILQGDSLDLWNEGKELQVSAVERLLLYFPNESLKVIADRVRELALGSDEYSDAIRNGVIAADLIRAMRPFKNAELEAALTDLRSESLQPEAIRAIDAVLDAWNHK